MENLDGKKDVIDFIKNILLKMENAEKLMAQNPPKHIPAYNKLLGILRKLEDLDEEKKKWFFPQSVMIRGVIVLFLNGRYKDGETQFMSVKKDFIKMVKDLEKE